MATQQQAKLLGLLQGQTVDHQTWTHGSRLHNQNGHEEGASPHPEFAPDEGTVNHEPFSPRHPGHSPARYRGPQGSATLQLPSHNAFAPSAPFSVPDRPAPNTPPVHAPAMPRDPALTSPWGAWGQTGIRPGFNASNYGKQANLKRPKNKTASRLGFEELHNSRPKQTIDIESGESNGGGLGHGLMKAGSLYSLPANEALKGPVWDKTTPIVIHDESQSYHQTDISLRSAGASQQVNMGESTIGETRSSSAASPSIAPPWSGKSIVVPDWNQQPNKPPQPTTSKTDAGAVVPSQAWAATRVVRPLAQSYARRDDTSQRSGRASRTQPTDSNADPTLEQFQRAKMELRADIDRRLQEKRQDKNATANLALLHSLRQPMSAENEKAIQAKIDYYGRMGESPVNWPANSEGDSSGKAAATFVLSREAIRNQNRNKDEQMQAANPSKDLVADWNVASKIQGSSNHVSAQAKGTRSKRNAKWVTAAEVRPERYEKNSNAWGSNNPDDATRSVDSVRAIQEGSFGRSAALGPDPDLVGWDGNFIEAPVEWERRPRLHPQKYYPGYGDYGQFLDEVFHQQYPQLSVAAIPVGKVTNMSLHADGIGMAERTQIVDCQNIVSYFGYSFAAAQEVNRDLGLITNAEYDREGPCPGLALEEVGYAETSEVYAQRLIAHYRKSAVKTEDQPEPPSVEPQASAVEKQLKPHAISVYLRPAVPDDLPQLVEIYNWHIENGPRPAEMRAISEADMRNRFDDAADNKLPIIVAVEKVKGKKQRRRRTTTNLDYHPMLVEEKIVGWGSAADWSASDYVERISVEIELYVEPHSRMRGVGRRLMDKMLQICDPGYLVKGGYDFHCLPETAHMYSEGGARDLHKIWFIVRTWAFPVKTAEDQKAIKASDREDEVDLWLKDWIESWDFKQEGHLTQIAAKNGRFLDQLQFGRNTMWLPREGQIPEPLAGTFKSFDRA